MFIDAHCHLEHALFRDDLAQVVERARKAEVKAVSCGVNYASCVKTLEIARNFPGVVRPALGLSPFDAVKEDVAKALGLIEESQEQIAAIAEIGLDYHYFKDERDRFRQKLAFEAQLELADTLGLAVEVHTRDAEEEVLGILRSYDCKKVLHCWLKPKLTEKALDGGCWLSVPTAKSKDRLKVLKDAPLDRLLCETDSPFLWPGRNEPANVLEAYASVAEVKKIGLKQVQSEIYATARSLFGRGLE